MYGNSASPRTGGASSSGVSQSQNELGYTSVDTMLTCCGSEIMLSNMKGHWQKHHAAGSDDDDTFKRFMQDVHGLRWELPLGYRRPKWIRVRPPGLPMQAASSSPNVHKAKSNTTTTPRTASVNDTQPVATSTRIPCHFCGKQSALCDMPAHLQKQHSSGTGKSDEDFETLMAVHHGLYFSKPQKGRGYWYKTTSPANPTAGTPGRGRQSESPQNPSRRVSSASPESAARPGQSGTGENAFNRGRKDQRGPILPRPTSAPGLAQSRRAIQTSMQWRSKSAPPPSRSSLTALARIDSTAFESPLGARSAGGGVVESQHGRPRAATSAADTAVSPLVQGKKRVRSASRSAVSSLSSNNDFWTGY